MNSFDVILYTPSMAHRYFCVARFQRLNSWAYRHEVRCLSSEEKTERVFSERNFLKATPGLKHVSERHCWISASAANFQTALLDFFSLQHHLRSLRLHCFMSTSRFYGILFGILLSKSVRNTVPRKATEITKMEYTLSSS